MAARNVAPPPATQICPPWRISSNVRLGNHVKLHPDIVKAGPSSGIEQRPRPLVEEELQQLPNSERPTQFGYSIKVQSRYLLLSVAPINRVPHTFPLQRSFAPESTETALASRARQAHCLWAAGGTVFDADGGSACALCRWFEFDTDGAVGTRL